MHLDRRLSHVCCSRSKIGRDLLALGVLPALVLGLLDQRDGVARHAALEARQVERDYAKKALTILQISIYRRYFSACIYLRYYDPSQPPEPA